MNEGRVPGASPTVCPFVALAEDRDRRADGPDERNRCYAEPAPRRRDLGYQADHCYSPGFAACPAFLAWAARNAAEPAYVSDAARRAWGSGISAPEAPLDPDASLDQASDAAVADARTSNGGRDVPLPPPSLDGGLFGPPPASETDERRAGSETLDWVSASAWADAPWDERAEEAAEELEQPKAEEPELDASPEERDPAADEALTAPKVPAALPMRRRQRIEQPIRTRGSGEWHYADPVDREPLVRRRSRIGAPILLGVLGLLVVAIVAFLLPTLLSGGGQSGTAAAPSTSPRASGRPEATRLPAVASTPREPPAPSPEASPRVRTYRVRSGDALSAIAARFDITVQQLQCRNRIANKNIISLDQRLVIPPEDYVCPSGWRNSTPEPLP